MCSYIDHQEWRPWGAIIRHSWRDFTYQRLSWLYGPERAWRIDNGNDPKTNADLHAWRNLGSPKRPEAA